MRRRVGRNSYGNKRWQVTLRDCTTLTWQDTKHCANCYRNISSCSNVKRFKEELLEFGRRMDFNPESITVVEALNNIFDIYRNSYRTKIILNDEYSLCRNCWTLLKKLYSSFAKFCDASSLPSFLYDFVGTKAKRVDQNVILDADVKQETNEDHFEEMSQVGESFWEGILDLDERETVFDGRNMEEDVSLPSRGSPKERQEAEQANEDFEPGHEDADITPKYEGGVIAISILNADAPTADDRARNHRPSRLEPHKIIHETRHAKLYESHGVDFEASDENVDGSKIFVELNQEKGIWQEGFQPNAYETVGGNVKKFQRRLVAKIIEKANVKRKSPHNKKHVCGYPNCGKAFDRPYHLRLHKFIHETKPSTLHQVDFQSTTAEESSKSKTQCNSGQGEHVNELKQELLKPEENLRKKSGATNVKQTKINRSAARRIKKYVCGHPDCGTSFVTPSALRTHKIIHETKPFTCKFCHRSYRDNETLSRHIDTKCPANQFRTKQQTRIKDWKQDSTVKIQKLSFRFACYCGEHFTKSAHLWDHSVVHEINNVTCSICCAGFNTYERLEQHLKTHEPSVIPVNVRISQKYANIIRETIASGGTCRDKGKRKWVREIADCVVCGKKILKTNMRKHLGTHRSERQAVCDICGSAFKTVEELKFHQRYVHAPERCYLCNICGQSFKMKQALVRHTRGVHSDSRHFKCNLCSKTYKWMEDLRKHLQLHKGLKFYCEKCGIDFTKKTNLRTHLKKSCTGIPQPKGKKKGRKPTIEVFDSQAIMDSYSADSCLNDQTILRKNLEDNQENLNAPSITDESSRSLNNTSSLTSTSFLQSDYC